MNINWAAPTIDIFNLFVNYPQMNINWAVSTIDIFNLFVDYPPIINIFRQLSEPFSLYSSHALTPRVFQCIWNACMSIPIQSNSHANI